MNINNPSMHVERKARRDAFEGSAKSLILAAFSALPAVSSSPDISVEPTNAPQTSMSTLTGDYDALAEPMNCTIYENGKELGNKITFRPNTVIISGEDGGGGIIPHEEIAGVVFDQSSKTQLTFKIFTKSGNEYSIYNLEIPVCCEKCSEDKRFEKMNDFIKWSFEDSRVTVRHVDDQPTATQQIIWKAASCLMSLLGHLEGGIVPGLCAGVLMAGVGCMTALNDADYDPLHYNPELSLWGWSRHELQSRVLNLAQCPSLIY